ncbi:MAG: 6-phosphogluconolactonase [Deltaproteobacteria bacterium]|nr:6-phosphogluconolactonase [Deltaproteobacteria bacterium]MBN2670750.1 6-phosphogluconolactonase [Deltaproteobacteria bacterium]
MTPKDLLIYKEKPALVQAAAQLIAGAIRNTLQHQSTCKFALAGGSTPGPAYAALADAAVVGDLPFEKIEIVFGDERCVAADHPDSNYAMARQAFGEKFDQFMTVHRVAGELDRIQAAAEYESALATPIDVLLLGMGPDCHVASLFPGSVAFAHHHAKAMAVQCPKPPPWRITITPEVIKQSKHVFILATGAEKAPALLEVFTKPVDPTQRPAQLVLDGTWLVDAAAASQLNLT